MAFFVLMMLIALAAPAGSYTFLGGSLTVCPKQTSSNGTTVVELRSKPGTYSCRVNTYSCKSGDCGTVLQNTTAKIAWDSYGLNWCQMEVSTKLRLPSSLPFEIQYPVYRQYNYGYGYWVNSRRGSRVPWKMMAHVDMGTRSDSGDPNRPPVSTMLPVLRLSRNCPRPINLSVFDPDGDRVRCRLATVNSSHECSFCSLADGFSLDSDSCSLSYTGRRYGYYPIELVVEDFPQRTIRVSYSDGSFTYKHPLSVVRRRRQIPFITEEITTTTSTRAQEGTTGLPTTSTEHTTVRTVEFSQTTNNRMTTTTNADTSARTHPMTTRTTHADTSARTDPTTTRTPHADTSAQTDPTTTRTPHADTSGQTDSTTTRTPHADTSAQTDSTTTRTPHADTSAQTDPTTSRTTHADTSAQTDPTTTATALISSSATPETTTANTGRYRSSIPPLSQLPMQFTVYVDHYSPPSCVDGEYYPLFLAPTPLHGDQIPAFINKTLEIKVRATAQNSRLYKLVVTGPRGISKRTVSTGSYIITWTPTENEKNCHFPICFLCEAICGSYYACQSEMRCVTVYVEHHEAVVTCNRTTMTVEVEKTNLMRRNEESLHLNRPDNSSCDLRRLSNSTHIVAVMSLNSCGTYVEEDEDNIIFTNSITSADPGAIISRQHEVDMAFSCSYPKRTNVTLGFRHKNPYAFHESGFGAFTFQFEFFQSQLFRRQVNASTYPVEVYLRQMIYMQIQATSSIPNTVLFVESCKATPYDNPNSRVSYTIIENGCVKDTTVQIFPSSRSQFNFGMQAFEFIGAHDEVYITCSVLLCESGVSGTRCSQGCIPGGHTRGRREAPAQTSSHFISQGPLHLVKTSDGEGEHAASGLTLNLGVNLLFIVGCLLAVGVVIYRSRSSSAKYQRLPTSDTD